MRTKEGEIQSQAAADTVCQEAYVFFEHWVEYWFSLTPINYFAFLSLLFFSFSLFSFFSLSLSFCRSQSPGH